MFDFQYRPMTDNPLDGIVPDFTIFGSEFTELWQKVFAAAWAVALIFSLFMLLKNVAVMAGADEDNPQKHKKASKAALVSGIVFGALVAFAVIVGVILAIVQV